MNDRGPLRVRFEVDASEQRTLSRVRGVSALLAFAGAATLLLGELPLPVFLLALLGLAISVAWLRQARKASRAARDTHRDALQVHEQGLFLDESQRTAWVPWREIEDIVVDEERLDVVVIRRGTPPLRIEPRFPGVDIYELMRTLNDARQAAGHPDRHPARDPARSPNVPPPGSPGWRR
jgi:hypothetical protein